MTLLVISPDYASHALPLVTLAGAWRDSGERVVVATGPAMAPLVAASGMELTQLVLGRGSNAGVARPEDQPHGEDDNLRAFFEATRRGMIATLRYQAEARARDLLWEPEAVARRTLDVVEDVRPDSVLVDHLAFGATIGLRAAGIPYADVVPGHPRQLPVAGETYGVPGAWPAAFLPDAHELADLRSYAGEVADRFTDAYNNALRRVAPGVEPVPDAFAAHGSTVLFNYPAALHDPRRTAALPERHAFLGATVRRDPEAPEVQRWLDRADERPIVLVSLGTFLSARADVLAIIAAGLRRLDVRVALATGSADPRTLGPVPAAWLVAPYLPQVRILEQARALVTHAGNNSVTEATAKGVPMLALPFSTDQFDGAAAIETAGFGLALDPNRLTGSEVATAIERLAAKRHPALDRLARQLSARPGPEIARAAVTGPAIRGAVAAAQRLVPGSTNDDGTIPTPARRQLQEALR